MRKRLKKKLGKYKCLKCGCQDGVGSYYKTPGGRWISGPHVCLYCDMGVDRKEFEAKVQARINEIN